MALREEVEVMLGRYRCERSARWSLMLTVPAAMSHENRSSRWLTVGGETWPGVRSTLRGCR